MSLGPKEMGRYASISGVPPFHRPRETTRFVLFVTLLLFVFVVEGLSDRPVQVFHKKITPNITIIYKILLLKCIS